MQVNKELQELIEITIKRAEKIINDKDELKNIIEKSNEAVFDNNPWDYSEKELDNEMAKLLTILNDNIDTKPKEIDIVSHRRFLGKFIVLIKRMFFKLMKPYTNVILEKQRYFNEKSVRLMLLNFIRLRKLEESIRDIESITEELKFLLEVKDFESKTKKNENKII